MSRPWMTVGLHVPPKPPALNLRALVTMARLMRLESLTVWDHFQDLFPQALWDNDFTWMSRLSASPHELFEFQVTLGNLAARAGRLRLGVCVTEPVRRHPVLIAQAMMTLAHMTRRAPILGLGTGERENTQPYGLDLSRPVSRLEEALQIIRMCFESRGPVDFTGAHFTLDSAVMDLQPPRRRTPEIWIAAHGPRMLELTGRFGDGWLPVAVVSPEDYAARLAVVRRSAITAGREPSRIRPCLQSYVVFAPTMREAQAMLDTRLIRFVALLAPAELWSQFGERHPFGEDFRGFVDFLPEAHTRQELDDALAAVPREALSQAITWGTPERVASRLRDFGQAGARHVNLELVSAAVSPKAALYAPWAAMQVSRALRVP
ncbi:MAG TPA: LLM class flavin-dependent oxidoreductase [Thermomicrobiales bacterium]|nr:LLM class flavin-dependent oxidoreductase [Thermomicrobiales bacterium]